MSKFNSLSSTEIRIVYNGLKKERTELQEELRKLLAMSQDISVYKPLWDRVNSLMREIAEYNIV